VNTIFLFEFIVSDFTLMSLSPAPGTIAPSAPERPHYLGFTITLRHTAFGGTPLDDESARGRDLYLTTDNHSLGRI